MLPGNNNQWKNDRNRNRQRTLTTIQLVPELGALPPANIAPQLSNSTQESMCARRERPKKKRRWKKKRKNATEQINLGPGTSFAHNITPRSNNSATRTIGPQNEKLKKIRKKRWRRNKQLAPGARNSVRNMPLVESNKPETLMSSEAFNPLSQNVVNTVKIKREIPDDSLRSGGDSFQLKSGQELTGTDDCELTAVVRPVRKFEEVAVHNWNEDVVYVGKSVIEKEVTEQLAPIRPTYSNSPLPEPLFPNNDESMECDTVPSSPKDVDASAYQSSFFTPEEIQFSLLQRESKEPLNHNLKPLSLLPSYKKDDIFCLNKLSGLISNADETGNIYDFTYELQTFCDANFNKDSLTLEELDVCVKVLSSILTHTCANFSSKNKLLERFTTSIQQIASYSHQSLDILDNTCNLVHNLPPESSNEQNRNNLHLENRLSFGNKDLPCEINEFNLTTLQNISESVDKTKDSDSLSLQVTLKSRKRPYIDQNNPAPFSESFLNTNPTSMPVTKKVCPLPSHISPSDPRLISKNNYASHSTTFSNTNSTSVPETNKFYPLPSHINPLNPRHIIKNNSTLNSKSFSSSNFMDSKELLEGRFASYTQPTQIQEIKPCSSGSIPVSKKSASETNSKYVFSDKIGENQINTVLGSDFDQLNLGKSPEQLSYNLNPTAIAHDREIKKISTEEQSIKHMIKPSGKSPIFGELRSPKIDNLSKTSSPTQLSPSIKSPTLSSKPFVNLLPSSLLQDIGVDFIPSSYVYLIATVWRVEWFSEYENKSKMNSSVPLPPIIKNSPLSQVLDSYQNEKEYYIIYFKLLLVDCWYKLYLSWRDSGQLNREYHGRIRDWETKNGFMKYVVEYFVPDSEKGNMPSEGFIVELAFTKFNGKIFRALGYVSNVTKRKFDSSYDSSNEAFKVLNVSGENILKYKVVIYTVYKCDDIDITKIVTHKNLMNIRYVLQQNDALCDLSKSPLSKVILDPIISAQRLSFSLPDENRSVSIPLNQICEHLSTPEPLLVLINSSLSFANKTSAMYYLVKEIQSAKPTHKVIICSKYEKKLSVISNELQEHGVIFVNNTPVPELEKCSLKKLVERKTAKYPNLNPRDVQAKLLRERTVILILLQEYLKFDILKKLKIACCILDDAHEYTEPESVIPLTYGITKFVLFGDIAISCDVTPISASYGYNRSLFNRASL